jgi:hypothetical protein
MKPYYFLFIPEWLKLIMGDREILICNSLDLRMLQVDCDNVRLPNHQQLFESVTNGSFIIDARLKQIIG